VGIVTERQPPALLGIFLDGFAAIAVGDEVLTWRTEIIVALVLCAVLLTLKYEQCLHRWHDRLIGHKGETAGHEGLGDREQWAFG
jgi:hypothetical protein